MGKTQIEEIRAKPFIFLPAGMEDHAVCDNTVGSPEVEINYLNQRVQSNESGMQELESYLKVLTKLDLDLAYSSEKLANLHVPLIYLLAQQNDLEAMATVNNYILADFIEKVLVFNFLSSILDSEVRELDNFMDALQAGIIDARKKISSCRHLGKLYSIMEGKLNDSEESLKQSQDQISELKMQSERFQRTVLAFAHENWKTDIAMDLSENAQQANKNAKSNLKMPRQQRHNLWMLEKSLSRELYLEKKLTESRQNEEELKLKLHHTEQVAFHMEEAAEVVWGRFLEAENAAEVLQGISKELLGRLQLIHFNLNGSIQRESELKFKLQASLEELKAKDTALQKLKNVHEENIKKDVELSALREKVVFLEKQLKESELQLKSANSTNESSQEKLGEMERLVESLKENIFTTEVKAESAELKVAELTGTNVELTEEMSFLKGSASNTEKRRTHNRIKFMMDMAMQLAIERERIQKQVHVLMMDKKLLVEKLWNTKKDATECNNEDNIHGSYDRVDEPSEEAPECDTDAGASSSASSMVSEPETSRECQLCICLTRKEPFLFDEL
ncbi:unnamed protein product [Prunus armeniaca]|uniref:WIT1/2 N-terminal helical bundle domain-containing protein n=1 Tax=Prunus armeniaca TaxID=36596 RepID=A0A6J5VA47_PRUAR|nr:unnamed protein product [Prunus armeniaca]